MYTALQPFLRSERIPLRLRKKVGKMIRLESGVSFEIEVLGAQYRGRTGHHIDNKVYLYGRHEAPTLRLIRHIAQSKKAASSAPFTYVDVGVNSGLHLVCGAAVSDFAYGFEPWIPMVETAQKNLDHNQFKHATLFPFGLSDEDATLPYMPPAGTNLGIGSFVKGDEGQTQAIKDITGASYDDTIALTVRNGDAVMQESGIVPNLIKIDTEGFEKPVLTGLRATLAAHRPHVIFEYSSLSRKDFPDMQAVQDMFPENYGFYGILPSRENPKLKPFLPHKRYENILAYPLEDAAFFAEML